MESHLASISKPAKYISRIWISGLIFAPFVLILTLSFLTKGPYGGVEYTFNLSAWLRFFSLDFLELFWPPFYRSILMAFSTTVICLLIAYPLSFYLKSQSKLKQNFLLLLIMFPFWTNFLVRIYAWMALLADNGWINHSLNLFGFGSYQMLYTPGAVLCGMVYNYFPYLLLPVFVSVEKIDMLQIDAAKDLGCGPIRLIFQIIFPQIKAGILAGSLLVFVPAFGEFAIPDILGGATNSYLGNLIAQQFLTSRNWPLGSVLSTITLLFSLGIFFLFKNTSRDLVK